MGGHGGESDDSGEQNPRDNDSTGGAGHGGQGDDTNDNANDGRKS
jgi:hypothetical protein